MGKIKYLVVAIFLHTYLSANSAFVHDNFDDEFIKMQNFINSMFKQSAFNQGVFYNYPRVNMEENEKEFVLEFELAGIDKKEIKLSIKNNLLVLEGEKKQENKNSNKNYIKQEMFYGKFKRIIKLPQNIVTDKIKNRYDNGVLSVRIPKKKPTHSNYKVLKIN